MIVCSNCQHVETEGALFCSECGTSLTAENTAREDRNQSAWEKVSQPRTSASRKIKVSLQVLSSGEELLLEGQEEFTIGRVSTDQSIIPDIDLSPFNAYSNGVSRIHASIRIDDDRIGLTDLSSVNGSYVNDEKIQPNVPRALKHGDMIKLGKLKIQILVRR